MMVNQRGGKCHGNMLDGSYMLISYTEVDQRAGVQVHVM